MSSIRNAAFIALLAFGTAPAVSAAPYVPDEEGLAIIVKTLSGAERPTTYEDYLAYLSRSIRMLDKDGDGLERTEVDLVDRIRAAAFRTQLLQRVLIYDLDNDRRVTADEIDDTLRSSPGNSSSETRRSILSQDANGDRVLDWPEMTAMPPQLRVPNGKSRDSLVFDAMTRLDPGGDGKFTLADARVVVDAIFGRFDDNKDGIISAVEFGELISRRAPVPADPERGVPGTSHMRLPDGRPPVRSDRRLPQPPAAPEDAFACRAPRVPPNAEVTYIGAYETHEFSSVHFGHPFDDTGYATVTVEKGRDPLYVVAVSYEPVVWKFEGDTKRVAALVVGGSRQVGGAIGIDRSKVTFVGYGECPGYDYDYRSLEDAGDRTRAENRLGHGIDHAGGAYSIERISIPSMRLEAKGSSTGIRKTAVEIDPSKVVSAVPAVRYRVLPGQAGIEQLVRDGSIQRVEESSTYRIVKPIAQFPSGLSGSRSVRFVLGKGVPMPDGDTGHSCVVSEETGEVVGPDGICR